MKVSVIFGVAIFLVASLAVIGALAYAFPAAPQAGVPMHGGNSPIGSSQSLMIAGAVNLKVYAPGGALVSNRNVPDPLTPTGIDALAACITGNQVEQGLVSDDGISCSQMILQTSIYIDANGGTCTFSGLNGQACYSIVEAATNYLEPLNCALNSATVGPCTGWETQSIYGPTTFTNSVCGTSCNVEFVGAGVPGVSFDTLCTATFSLGSCGSLPSIATVSPGQTLVVTITYTIS